jgi:hypothetical protein
MVLKIYQQVLKISFMRGFLINVTKQKLLMEEMGTEFDAMCRIREACGSEALDAQFVGSK